jgi:hypothetical protein
MAEFMSFESIQLPLFAIGLKKNFEISALGLAASKNTAPKWLTLDHESDRYLPLFPTNEATLEFMGKHTSDPGELLSLGLEVEDVILILVGMREVVQYVLFGESMACPLSELLSRLEGLGREQSSPPSPKLDQPRHMPKPS